jgi:hypothetical protein
MVIMRSMFGFLLLIGVGLTAIGCGPEEKPYGRERIKVLLARRQQIWAVAPVINLSGEKDVDPFLQADLVVEQLGDVRGVTPVPVNRVAEVYAALRIDRVSSPQQAALVCDLLQCDGLIIPTVTIFDSYNPPKFGGALQLFIKPTSFVRPPNVDPRELARQAAPTKVATMPASVGDVVQAAGMFDATNGTVRDRVHLYAVGRWDPKAPLEEREYYMVMDRYCGFAYSELIEQILVSPKLKGL